MHSCPTAFCWSLLEKISAQSFGGEEKLQLNLTASEQFMRAFYGSEWQLLCQLRHFILRYMLKQSVAQRKWQCMMGTIAELLQYFKKRGHGQKGSFPLQKMKSGHLCLWVLVPLPIWEWGWYFVINASFFIVLKKHPNFLLRGLSAYDF